VIVTQLVMSVPALVMKIFEPLITHLPSRSSAVVREAAASDPAPGSVRPNAASLRPDARSGSHCRFCSSLPNSRIGIVPSAVCGADELGLGREVDVHRCPLGKAGGELDDQPNSISGAPALREVVAARALQERGAGDVGVRPRALACELLEERGREDRARLA